MGDRHNIYTYGEGIVLPGSDHGLVKSLGISRKVPSYTMDVSFCLEALEEALAVYGTPEIFNTDQGGVNSHQRNLPRPDFQRDPNQHGWKVVWLDNVFVERLWKSVKYEEVYLKAYDSLVEDSSRTKGLF